MQTGCRTAHAGSRLKPLITQEGTAWKASLPVVLGKPAVRNDRGGSRKRRHHSKPDQRLDPTRLLGAESAVSSENPLISLRNRADFDSTIRRFESSRPSQPV